MFGGTVMPELQLTVTAEEREFLTDLLETTLRDMQIEEHRTRSLSYRELVLHQEHLVASLLSKIGKAPAAANL